MRRLVVFDRDGTIVATAPHPDDMPPPEPGAPTFLGFSPAEDEQQDAIDIPEELSSPEGIRELHESYRVEMIGDRPTLTRR
ncbi:MAG TPA: hypothetical protein VH419_12805 [Nocardioidaceae bacterium]